MIAETIAFSLPAIFYIFGTIYGYKKRGKDLDDPKYKQIMRGKGKLEIYDEVSEMVLVKENTKERYENKKMYLEELEFIKAYEKDIEKIDEKAAKIKRELGWDDGKDEEVEEPERDLITFEDIFYNQGIMKDMVKIQRDVVAETASIFMPDIGKEQEIPTRWKRVRADLPYEEGDIFVRWNEAGTIKDEIILTEEEVQHINKEYNIRAKRSETVRSFNMVDHHGDVTMPDFSEKVCSNYFKQMKKEKKNADDLDAMRYAFSSDLGKSILETKKFRFDTAEEYKKEISKLNGMREIEFDYLEELEKRTCPFKVGDHIEEFNPDRSYTITQYNVDRWHERKPGWIRENIEKLNETTDKINELESEFQEFCKGKGLRT